MLIYETMNNELVFTTIVIMNKTTATKAEEMFKAHCINGHFRRFRCCTVDEVRYAVKFKETQPVVAKSFIKCIEYECVW